MIWVETTFDDNAIEAKMSPFELPTKKMSTILNNCEETKPVELSSGGVDILTAPVFDHRLFSPDVIIPVEILDTGK